MAQILSGKPVANAICSQIETDVSSLKELGIQPVLCVIRLGEEPSDISYERGIMKRAQSVGIVVRSIVLPRDTCAVELISLLTTLSKDESVHGVLLFRPLPSNIRRHESEILEALDPNKDIDGMTTGSSAGVYLNRPYGYAPCTPSACVEILQYYGIDPTGKRVVVIGRSAVVGKPLAMLLLNRNATVTICHTKTENLIKETLNADILVACAGQAEMVTEDFIAPGAVVIDVGVNWSAKKSSYVGDVLIDDNTLASAYTPVPGGVGAVTTSILLRNVVSSAKKSAKLKK